MQSAGSDQSCPSLMHGVFEAACSALGIANLRHKSALLALQVTDDLDLAEVIHKAVAANWVWGDAAANRDRSQQNWRWALQPQIGSGNRSPEVVLERAVAAACVAANRDDWANQIPRCFRSHPWRFGRTPRDRHGAAHRRADVPVH